MSHTSETITTPAIIKLPIIMTMPPIMLNSISRTPQDAPMGWVCASADAELGAVGHSCAALVA